MSGTLNSQILYNWASGGEPLRIEGQEKPAVGFDHFQEAMGAAEASFGQIILQRNQDSRRQAGLISDQGLVTLDTATATAADVAAETNKLKAIMDSLILLGKDRG